MQNSLTFQILTTTLIITCFQTDFRLVSLIAAGITMASLLIVFMLPESPVYLVTHNKLEKARDVLALLRSLRK